MRKSNWFVVAAAVLACLASGAVAQDVSWYVEALPASIHSRVMSDNFDAERMPYSALVEQEVIPGTVPHEYQAVEEESISLLSIMPTVAVGLECDMENMLADLKLGGGLLLNAHLHSPMLFGQAGLSFEAKRSLWIGPHVGLAWFSDPEWYGDAAPHVLRFNDEVAPNYGVHVVFGDKIAYVFSIDYVDLEFDFQSPVDEQGFILNDDYTRTGWRVDDGTVVRQQTVEVEKRDTAMNQHHYITRTREVNKVPRELEMQGIAVQFGVRMRF